MTDDITAERQKHRDEFVKQLHMTYPDPKDSVRQQIEPMLDQWWPGTKPSEEER